MKNFRKQILNKRQECRPTQPNATRNCASLNHSICCLEPAKLIQLDPAAMDQFIT